MKNWKKILLSVTVLSMLTLSSQSVFAEPTKGEITGKTVLAGALSLIVWPGIGQAVNDNKGKKVLTHAIIGLLPPYRFWSCYDAVVDRKGGYWEDRI